MRVLLVDPDYSRRSFWQMCLAGFPRCQIDHEDTISRVLSTMENHVYDLLVFNAGLPGKTDVLPVLESIRRGAAAKTPVILYDFPLDKGAEALAARQDAVVLPRATSAETIRTIVSTLLDLDPFILPTGAEKREAPRLKTAIKVTLDGPVQYELVTEDFSALGAFLLCDTPAPVGTSFRATLHIQHIAEPIVVPCRVIHVRKPVGDLKAGFGVSFQPKSADERTRLFDVLMLPDLRKKGK